MGSSGRIRVGRRRRPWWRSKRRRTQALQHARRVLLWAGAVIGGSCAISLALCLPSIWRAATEGRDTLLDGSDAVLARNDKLALDSFRRSRDVLEGTEERLSSAFAWPLKVVPFASAHVRAAESLSRAAARVADLGVVVAEVITELPEHELQLIDGQVDLGVVQRVSRLLGSRLAGISEIPDIVDGIPSGWLLGPLRYARQQARDLLPDAVEAIEKASISLDALPNLLGADRPKRYIVAFSSLAELRGTGGLYGYVTELDAADGDLDLADTSGEPLDLFPPPAAVGLTYPDWFSDDFRVNSGIFLNINLTTDFPTVGKFIVETASAVLGNVDGVIAVDPLAISSLLRVTGPITVPTWNGEITAENVSEIAHNDVYVQISDREGRDDFYEQLVRTTFDRLTSGDIRISPRSAGAIDAAVRGGHLRMYSEHAADQAMISRLGLSGSVDHDRATDVLSLVSENASGNKIDWYLRRDVQYRVRLDPESGVGKADLVATFRNTAPASGLPDYVIGSLAGGLARGSNRSLLLLIRAPPEKLDSLQIGDDDDPTAVREREGRLRSYRSSLEIPAMSGITLKASSTTPGALIGDGTRRTYRLEVLPQALAHPDHCEVVIEVPRGWSARGRTRFSGDLTRPLSFDVEFTRTRRATFVDEVILDPARAIGRFLGGLF
ncbi:MAG: DUF4012 domain-containing protein [Actinomycetota bacterium]